MKYFLSISLLFYCLHLSAQEKHFIFIQSDNSQPFYVSLTGKLYSSSASGYLIIPKLLDGEYKFAVGFAKNEFPEQSFQCVINKKDLGYNLKNFGDKGWGLFNLQTLDVTMAGAGTNEVAKAVSEIAPAKPDEPLISFEKKKDTVAAQPVSKPVEDTLVAQASVTTSSDTAKAVVAEADAQAPVVADSTNAAKAGKQDETIASQNSALKKVAEVKGADGVYLSYVDSTGKNADTIQVIIPSMPSAAGTDDSKVSSDEKTSADAEAPQKPVSSSAVTEKNGVRFLDIDMNNVRKDTAAKTISTNEPAVVAAPTSNCKNIATDEDYTRLRKKMAMETSDEKMISEAKKFYRNKCFTTSQIKGLSSLFLSDEGRYKFFDASYVSVADASQYQTLQSEFIDKAFAARFKSMLQ